VQKLKSEGAEGQNSYYFTMLLNLGIENSNEIKKTSGKKPMFSEQSLRDLAEVIAQKMLKIIRLLNTME
jgi:hypothetical protein